jgi:hypothetical protein
VFATRTGRPIEPRNLVRLFRRICEANNIRLIKVHHIRHTIASLLKALHVPARYAQVILGYSRMAVTLHARLCLLAARLGARDPDALARQLMVLADGAASGCAVQRGPEPAHDARELALIAIAAATSQTQTAQTQTGRQASD